MKPVSNQQRALHDSSRLVVSVWMRMRIKTACVPGHICWINGAKKDTFKKKKQLQGKSYIKNPPKNGMMNKKSLSHIRHKLSGCGRSNVICFWEKVLDLISQIMGKESSLKP